MPNTQLILGQQEAFFFITTLGPDNNGHPAAIVVSVDDYSKAYVASSDGGHTVHVVPKALGTVTVTVAGHSDNGTAIPSVTRSFDIVAPPAPQATSFVLSADNVAAEGNAPPDPGTGTITGNVD